MELVPGKQLFALHYIQLIYRGCYDGLEEFQAKLNQGVETALSFLMTRLAVNK
jgi:hypothetical protein